MNISNLPNEQWKNYNGEIKALHGLLKVSNMGRIFKIGTHTSKNQSKILKGTISSYGYIRIHLSINGEIYNLAAHRIIAEVWCPNPENKPFIDHINANRQDNRACNLRWVTSHENNMNPHYLKEISKRQKKLFENNNWLISALKKTVIAENINGTKLKFDSIQELQEHFKTKANVSRIIKNKRFVKSSKSKLKGWKIYTVD